MFYLIIKQIEVKVFIHNFREAFGVTADLPFVFWYSDISISEDIDKKIQMPSFMLTIPTDRSKSFE